MKKFSAKAILFIFVLSSTLIAVQSAQAESETSHKTNGLGVIVGEPSGFTGKFWVASEQAIDVGLGFSFNNFTMIYSDFLLHFHGAFGLQNEFLANLEPYMGVGGELFFAQDSARIQGHYFTSDSTSSVGFGLRVPVGAEWFLPRAPLGVFAEIVPGVGIAPNTFGFLESGVGIRYYF